MDNGKLFINVHGKKVEVGITDAGTFYDKENKAFNAKTLKGLQKKMSDVAPNANIRVQHTNEDGKLGTVLSRRSNKGYNSSYFIVKWDNGTTEEEYYHHLERPSTPQEREELKKLKEEADTAQAEYSKASSKLSNFRQRFSILDKLDAIFPRN